MRGKPVWPAFRGSRRFRLRIETDRTGQSRLVLLQERPRRGQAPTQPSFEPVAWASGLPLDVARPLAMAALRTNGGSPEQLGRPPRNGQPPLDLDEASGARVALALLAVQPLRKLERMQDVVQGIEAMSPEEALYWFARVLRGPKARTLRALRILLARE